MAHVTHVYCRSTGGLTSAEVARFIRESGLFPRASFEPTPGEDSEWTELSMRYEPSEPPLVIRRARPEVLAEQLRSLRFVLDASRPSRGRERLAAHLASIAQLVTLEVSDAVVPEDPSRPSDAWELLCAVEAFVARSLDGVIEAPCAGRSNTFSDARRKVFHRL